MEGCFFTSFFLIYLNKSLSSTSTIYGLEENTIHINHLFVKNPEEINWLLASRNANGLHFVLKNPKKIVWNEVSSNPRGIELLKRNPEKIDWKYLSMNSNAIELYKGMKIN